jgi:histidyl-tRNA synthetase
MGIERILLVSEEPATTKGPGAFVVVTDPALRRDAAVLLSELRHAGLSAEADLRGGSVKSQLRRADKVGALTAIILGPAEVERAVVQLKDLRAGQQTEVPRDEMAAKVLAVVTRERA